MPARPTIEDVAEIAGVSTATVSRAIHNPDIVSKKTREAVFRAVRQSGYTQNAAAQTLRQKRSRTFVILVPNIGNTFFLKILAGIEAAASSAGMTMIIAHTGGAKDREVEFLRYLLNGRADGALLLNGSLPEEIRAIHEANPARPLPIISISEEIENSPFPHIGIDNVLAARLAVQHLLELGHRKIAHITGPPGNILTAQRRAGYEQVVKEAGGCFRKEYLIEGDFTAACGKEAAHKLLHITDRPTAVFCGNDETAIALISELNTLGIRVPQDMSICGFDDILFAETTIPGLTTIRQPRFELGNKAMNLLLKLLRNEPLCQETLIRLPADLIIRNSTGQP